ncbi:MAG: biopolymer transporter ExbD [Chlamydiota bacterium]
MNLIPEEHWQKPITLNLTPMIDFLFVLLAFFITLAITRVILFDTNLDLAQLKKEGNAQSVYQDEVHKINLSVSEKGDYKWITEIHDYQMENVVKIQKELLHEYALKLLPEDKSKTKVLLYIDRKAPWEPIAKLIFGVREVGFEALPIYEPDAQK